MAPRIQRIEALRSAVVAALARGTWETIKDTFRKVDLQWREDLGPGSGKPKYAERVLIELKEPDLISLAKRVIERMATDAEVRSVEDALWWIEDGITQRISEVTRGELAEAFDGRVLSPRLSFDEFLKQQSGIEAAGYAFSNRFAYSTDGRICRREASPHPFLTDKSQYELSNHREALGKAGFFAWPDRRVLRFLEALVEPKVRTGEEQRDWILLLNQHLAADGFRLEEFDKISGHPVFRALPSSRAPRGRPKNLIFASDQEGFKPILGFSDALDNDVVALQNEDTCLIYHEPVPDEGLTWDRLVEWWSRSKGVPANELARKSLGERLTKALASPPERVLFASYFRSMKDRFGGALPALLPQVYVHYDPRNRAERSNNSAFLVQRMDFLMLLPGRVRVVIEVDGKQHYSVERPLTQHDIARSAQTSASRAVGVLAMLPSPEVYAETVRADRELRLRGYDVYRFGGHELTRSDSASLVESFFDRLFNRLGVQPII